MYRRLAILSGVILLSLAGLGWLGYRAIEMQADGLKGRRWAEFASVAEQIRRDVNLKLEDFRRAEQQRPYTHYQYNYIPVEIAQTNQRPALLRSPLGNNLDNGLAYGYFQVEPDGRIIAPFLAPGAEPAETSEAGQYVSNLRQNLLPSLNGRDTGRWQVRSEAPKDKKKEDLKESKVAKVAEKTPVVDDRDMSKKSSVKGLLAGGRRGKAFPIESLQSKSEKPQVLTQNRAAVEQNYFNTAPQQQMETESQNLGVVSQRQQSFNYSHAQQESGVGLSRNQQRTPASQSARTANPTIIAGQTTAQRQMMPTGAVSSGVRGPMEPARRTRSAQAREIAESGPGETTLQVAIEKQQEQAHGGIRIAGEGIVADERIDQVDQEYYQDATGLQEEMVQILIEPLVPVAAGGYHPESLFGEQIFLVRHVQIEERHFMQGFRLNEKALVEEVTKSARRLMREGMSFTLGNGETDEAVYTAILDFGFGELVLNLAEVEPGWIGRQVRQLYTWYFGIVAVVLLVVGLGVASLWRNVRSQLKLAQQKDNFISAVSHELRTPLTSIRMYTEMLEKGWLKTEAKRAEYLQNMRQESERLSRLIENVLDFSRIQRNKKKYEFQVGNINECVTGVVEMMQPYAAQQGFVIEKDLQTIGEVAFDRDAVMQIAINLMDNAVKYAREAKDKKIVVRTSQKGQYVFLEVEDHGPGIPHRQRNKVFDEFYRCQEENRRETTGTGLGLALVKKFAEAHDGFVEILTAQPTGAIFRVGLATHN